MCVIKLTKKCKILILFQDWDSISIENKDYKKLLLLVEKLPASIRSLKFYYRLTAGQLEELSEILARNENILSLGVVRNERIIQKYNIDKNY